MKEKNKKVKKVNKVKKPQTKKPIKKKDTKFKYVPSFWQVFTSTFGGVIQIIFAVLLIIGVAVGSLGLGLVKGWIDTAHVITDQDIQIQTDLTTFIYDSDGFVIEKLTGSDNINREQVGYKDIPLSLEQAIIAIEDERFYEHDGFDIVRIGGSVLALFENSGSITQGGSTLTQQVYKNITNRFEQTFERKFQEIYNAIMLEMQYDKKQIITLYANIINMGNGSYGVQSASKMYFGKAVSELNIAESALLAGIPNAPSTYNPYTEAGLENSLDRQKLVLNKMYELGFITYEEFSDAVNYEIIIMEKDNLISYDRVTSYAVDHVINEVIDAISEEYDVTKSIASQWVYNNGYRIYTTINSDMQETMDSVYLNEEYFPTVDEESNYYNPDAEKYAEIPQSSMVIINQKNGEIQALYGGNGEKVGSRTYNRATQSTRQPGSSFKPIAVYGPAIDLRLITPATIVDDTPSYLDPKNPDERYPSNYTTGDFEGLTSIRNALKASVNVVAAKVWVQYLGRDNCVDYLKRVGIDRDEYIYDDTTVSVATGGLEVGVSPLEMASAYTVFPNKGVYIEDHIFREVLDNKGNVVVAFDTPYTIAYSEVGAYLMVDMMQEVTTPANSPYGSNGTANTYISIQDKEMPVGGKTGTTSEWIDKWFVGYTPYYTAAVWYGYDNNISPISLVRAEYQQAQKIWNAVMEEIHTDLPVISFDKPLTGLIERDICIYSGQIATDLCTQDPRGDCTFTEIFIEGTEPSPFDTCEVHQIIPQCIASVDSNGNYLLATEDCPQSTIINEVGIVRPVQYIPVNEDDPNVKDVKYEIPVGEYCTIHGVFDSITTDIVTSP